MIRSTVAIVIATSAIAGCSGETTADQATEEGASAAAVEISEALFAGDPATILAALTDECRGRVDEGEFRSSVSAMGDYFSVLGIDPAAVDIDATVTSFTTDRAEIEVTYDSGDEATDELLGGGDAFTLVFDGDRWVLDGCDYADDEPAATDLDAELAAAGFAATLDDPAPGGEWVPIGDGIEVGIADLSEVDNAVNVVALDVAIGYSGRSEPRALTDVMFSIVGGGSGVEYPQIDCGAGELDYAEALVLSGGVLDGPICFELPGDEANGALVVATAAETNRPVYLDPTTSASLPTTITANPDASLGDRRLEPVAVGEPIEVGDWTLTVNEAAAANVAVEPEPTADTAPTATSAATEPTLAPSPLATSVALVDVTIAYAGPEPTVTLSALTVGIGGDDQVITRFGCGAADDLTASTPMDAGGTIEGTMCFTIPTDQLATAQLFVGATDATGAGVFDVAALGNGVAGFD